LRTVSAAALAKADCQLEKAPRGICSAKIRRDIYERAVTFSQPLSSHTKCFPRASHAHTFIANTTNMKNIYLLLLFVALGLKVSAQEKVINDANAATRNAKDFHAIEIGDGVDLYLTQSNEEAVAVSASKPEYRNKIYTVVEDGILKIYYGSRNDWNFSFNNNRKLRAYVSCKSLDRLVGSGGSDITINGTLKIPKLRLSISGGSDFKGAVETDDLNISASGGSDVVISGRATNLKIDASGGSDFKGYDLNSETCYAEGSGGSDMQLRVSKELNVNTSGGSDVYYKGSAVIREQKTSGGGSVSKRD